MKRELIENLERRKDMMIGSLWANSGFEGKEGAQARQSAIQDIEEHYDQAVYRIQNNVIRVEEEEIDEDNPFFEAMKRGQAKLEQPRDEEGIVREVIDYSKEIDQ